MDNKNILGIIPARYGSTRLEGKPLADIHGKPMIQWVYERASQALENVLVATDDERIMQAVANFGGKAILTATGHSTGTNRCLEAYQHFKAQNATKIDVVVNIQGDEPLLEPALLRKLSSCFKDTAVQMATLATEVSSPSDLMDDTIVFLTIDQYGDALYFSRSPIPHIRGIAKEHWTEYYNYHKHIGLYAYTPAALQAFANMPMGKLEHAESLEQLRWLEAGKNIRVEIVDHLGISVDTLNDLEAVREIIKRQGQ